MFFFGDVVQIQSSVKDSDPASLQNVHCFMFITKCVCVCGGTGTRLNDISV